MKMIGLAEQLSEYAIFPSYLWLFNRMGYLGFERKKIQSHNNNGHKKKEKYFCVILPSKLLVIISATKAQ